MDEITIVPLLNRINQYILNPIILLAFAIAFVAFFIGIVQFINSETADSKREKGKAKIIWGVVGMFVMFSAFGLIRLVLGTLGLQNPGYLPL